MHSESNPALAYPQIIHDDIPLALSTSWLSVLPVELTLQILSALDFRSLLVCKGVCRRLYMLVHGSAALQYCIQLGVDGMEDGPPNAVSAAERLDKLRQYKAARDDMKWVRGETVETVGGNLWELYGGVLAQCDRDKKIIKFRQIPSNYRGVEGQVWSIETPVGIRLRDFTMDPSQDLLVLVENPSWATAADGDRAYRIHFRNLRTGEEHRSANLAVVTHKQDTQDPFVRYTLQVSGDYVGVLFHGHDGETELLIVGWKTGHFEMRVIGDEIRSFAFLTDQLVMLGVLSTETIGPRLLVVNFKDAPPHGVPLDKETEYVTSFYFPELTSEAIPLEITIRSDPAPTWMPNRNLQVPFFTARNVRLYVLTIWVRQDDQLLSTVLFIPSFTLLSRLTNVYVDPIRWEDWGPDGTRMMLSPGHSHIWVCYVFGTRFVVLKQVGQTTGIQVYDFNQLALRHALISDDVSSDFVKCPSIIPSHGIFVNDVHTSLPYRIRAVSLQMEPSHAVMCSEDSLVIVQKNNERQFRILTF